MFKSSKINVTLSGQLLYRGVFVTYFRISPLPSKKYNLTKRKIWIAPSHFCNHNISPICLKNSFLQHTHKIVNTTESRREFFFAYFMPHKIFYASWMSQGENGDFTRTSEKFACVSLTLHNGCICVYVHTHITSDLGTPVMIYVQILKKVGCIAWAVS